MALVPPEPLVDELLLAPPLLFAEDRFEPVELGALAVVFGVEVVPGRRTLFRTRPVAAVTVSLARFATPGARAARFFAIPGARWLTASAAFFTADGAPAVTRRTTSGVRAATLLATSGARSATLLATSGARSVTFFATPGAPWAILPMAFVAWSLRSFALLLMSPSDAML
ncbi:MAG TPA: hypothetical protein VF660_03975 [Actinomycetota bacterium]